MASALQGGAHATAQAWVVRAVAMAFSDSTPLPVTLSLEPGASCPLPAWYPWGDGGITIPCGSSGDEAAAQGPSWDDLLGTR
jgi:hypothetical protein